MTSDKKELDVALSDIEFTTPGGLQEVMKSLAYGVLTFARAGLVIDPAALTIRAREIEDHHLLVTIKLPQGNEVSTVVTSDTWRYKNNGRP